MAKDVLNVSPSTSEGTGHYESTEPQSIAKDPKTVGEQPLGSPGGIFGKGNEPAPAPKPSALQTDINASLQTYVNELTNLGPEYGAELKYLAPYMSGSDPTGLAQEQAVAKEWGGSGVQALKPTAAAEELGASSANVAKTLESQTKPGFGGIASAAKKFEETIPYSDILNTVLTAPKNEILYGSTPNFSVVNTSSWGPSMQALYGYLSQPQVAALFSAKAP